MATEQSSPDHSHNSRLSAGGFLPFCARTMKWILVTIMLCVLTVPLPGVQRVSAHAAPAKVTPGNGAVLNAGPATVVIEMSQDMARQAGGNDIDVFGPDGGEVTTEPATIDGANRRILTVRLPSPLAPGTYVIKWKSLSSDDADPANGEELSFTIDPNATPQAGQEVVREDLLGGSSPTAEAPGPALIEARQGEDGVTWVLAVAVGIGALVLGSGGTFLLVQKHPEPAASPRPPKKGAGR